MTSPLKSLLSSIKDRYEKTKYAGEIIRIIYSAPGYCVALLNDKESKHETIKIVCTFNVNEGDNVVVHGKWEDVPRFGWQFKANLIEQDMDLDLNGLYKFLVKNKDIKGIGKAKASKIVEKYGDNFDEVISNNSQLLVDKLKIAESAVKNLKEVWIKHKMINQVVVNLSSFPLTQNQIETIISMYGQSAIEVIKADPYSMLPIIPSFSFLSADKIALSNGVSKDSTKRLEACVLYALANDVKIDTGGEHSRNDCWILEKDLIDIMVKLLDVDQNFVINYLRNDINTEKIKSFVHEGVRKYADAHIYMNEEYVIQYIMENTLNSYTLIHAEQLNKFNLLELNKQQFNAVEKAFRYNFSIITGKAGTGKTFVITHLIKCFESLGLRVACAAPTGKAARRMEEVTGYLASTIHRLLLYDTKRFQYNENNKLTDFDVIIIDEFSMVDIKLAYALFSAIGDDAKVILVGDHNQLPPIGVGNIFYDLLQYDKRDDKKFIYPVTELTEIVRQAGKLKFNSTSVLDGELIMENSDDWKVAISDAFLDPINVPKVISRKMENSVNDIGYEVEDIQIITATKEKENGVNFLNKVLQKSIQKKKYNVNVDFKTKIQKLYLHDRVIQMKNDYEIEVMNGTLGYVIRIENDITTIKFDGDKIIEYEKDDIKIKNVSLAYALTIHKTQGSEFPCVIVALHNNQWMMLNKNLLYTAVTRAKEKVIIIGDHKAIQQTMTNDYHMKKRTNFDHIVSVL